MFYIGVPGTESQLWLLMLTLCQRSYWKAALVVQVIGFLPPAWEIGVVFPSTDSWPGPRLVIVHISGGTNEKHLSLSLSLSLSSLMN